VKTAKHLSTYILAPRSILDVYSLAPNWCVKTLRESPTAIRSRPQFSSNPRVFAPSALPSGNVRCFYGLIATPRAYKIHNWPRPRKRKRLLQIG
jgi:hypothetical protein